MKPLLGIVYSLSACLLRMERSSRVHYLSDGFDHNEQRTLYRRNTDLHENRRERVVMKFFQKEKVTVLSVGMILLLSGICRDII